MRMGWTFAELAIGALNVVVALLNFAYISPESRTGLYFLTVGLVLTLVAAFRCYRLVRREYLKVVTTHPTERPVPDEVGVLTIIAVVFGGPVVALFILRASAGNHWSWQLTASALVLVAVGVIGIFTWFTSLIVAGTARETDDLAP